MAPERKAEGRDQLGRVARLYRKFCEKVSVRINNDQNWKLDCLAAIESDVTSILVPKCESADTLTSIRSFLDGRSSGIEIFPVIESAAGVNSYDKIIDGPTQFSTVFFGCEDFATSIGVLAPSPLNTLLAVQTLIYKSAPRNIDVVGSNSRFNGFANGLTAEYRGMAKDARDIGFAGTIAIHPKQVPIINEVFSYAEEKEAIERVLALSKEKGAVFSEDGRMYGPPMIKRYLKFLSK